MNKILFNSIVLGFLFTCSSTINASQHEKLDQIIDEMKTIITDQSAQRKRNAKDGFNMEYSNYSVKLSNEEAKKAFQFLGKGYNYEQKEFEKGVKEHLENLCDSISDSEGQKNLCLSQLPKYKTILCGSGSLAFRNICEDSVEANFKDVKNGIKNYLQNTFEGLKNTFGGWILR